MSEKSYFTIFENTVVMGVVPYDIYINSSRLPGREHFVRIFAMGDVMDSETVLSLKRKYLQLYVAEEDRGLYLSSLSSLESVSLEDKTSIVKNSAISYLGTLFDDEREFSTEVLGQAVEGCKEVVGSMVDVLEDQSIEDVRGLISSLSFHDFYTFDHSVNVSMYCITILRGLKPKASREELLNVGMGGLLHDIGKMKIPNKIINKAGKLEPEEFEEIKKHPAYGLQLLKEHGITCEGVDLDIISRVVAEHHENYNGSGYPGKLSEKEIHIYARICAIADFFDAITTKRSYHEVLPTPKALLLMKNAKGKKIDPKLFDMFVKIIGEEAKGTLNFEVPDEFDPCQPAEQLLLFELEEVQDIINHGKIVIK